MLRPLHDPDLAIPDVPTAPPGLLDFGMAPLGQEAAPDTPFEIDTRGVLARGTAAHGFHVLTLDRRATLLDLRVDNALTVRALRTSLGLQRTLDVNGTVCSEHIFVLPDVPAITFEWAANERIELVVEWRVEADPAGGPLRWHRTDDVFVATNTTQSALCMAFTSPVLEWSVTDVGSDRGSALHVRARIACDPDGIRLHAAAAPTISDLDAVLAPLRNVVALSRSLAAVQRRRDSTQIAISTPDAGLDLRFAWAKQQISLAPVHTSNSEHDALHALALVTAGDVASARTALERIEADHPLFLLLVARYHAWTADTRAVSSAWPRVSACAARALDLLDSHMATAGHDALINRALAEIAAAAADIGQRDFAAAARARLLDATVDAGDALHHTHWLEDIRHPAARALVNGPEGQSSEETILGVAYGVFGLQPDAARNRLRIRPRLPASWTRATLRNVRMGDATVTLQYAVSGGTHTFTAVQETGGVPVRLILEPRLSVSAVRATTIDGQPAALDARVVGDRIMVPVQLVLDETRVLVVEAEPGL